MFAEDLSVFFQSNDFADLATFADAGTAYGILDNEYIETYNSTGFKPVFTCATTDVASYGQGDTLTINSVNYRIDEKEADGTGVTRLLMRTV